MNADELDKSSLNLGSAGQLERSDDLIGRRFFRGREVSVRYISGRSTVSTEHRHAQTKLALTERDARDVRWKTVGEMVLAWIVTLPIAAGIAAVVYYFLRSRA